ncbi:LysR family transcriptional regulator [Glaciimonas sp. PAMC28666]|uniref:LysR family transcriptional regulator n=1 Tax=Glaciimonas sp. PAMC28666 TaxID=2807626 RepID=UPI001962C6A1|nr:LysR family transcriptional regulator [Glaciimonas sp. PAMC28666]QRX81809.1 LysR family transcriptional regulator [Glaciimonas sp. PAMC28666]
MDNVDIKMLRIFEEIYRTQSISRAAENLDLGQPAVSMALAKFRRHYGDQLFVRTSNGMEPTALADEIIDSVRLGLSTLTSTLEHRANFDPAVSDRMFRICMTDVGQRVMMPTLLAHFKVAAAAIRIDLTYVSEKTAKHLESGELDLALGFLTGLGHGFFQQALFTERFVCLVSSDHPRLNGDKVSIKQFEAESHLVVSTQGTGHSVVEKMFEEQGIRRKIGLRIPNFLGVLSNIIDTEYLAIVPERFGKIVAANNSMKLLELQFDLPDYRVMQHWHERYSNDPGVTWLRNTVMELFSSRI